MTKSELRKLYLEKRNSLGPEEHRRLSRKIVDRLFAEIDLAAVDSVHCFISMAERGEVETGSIFKRIWNDHPNVKTFAPRVNSTTGEIDALPYREESPLTLSKWGIPEPADGEPAQPEEMDIVLVPLLCFDARGYRVGYGKGYYDRFLAKCRPGCLKLGLSFFPPVDKIDDTFAGDVRLDRFITPDG